MSRIGIQPITIPAGVIVNVSGQHISVKGKLGTLERDVRPEITVEVKENALVLSKNEKNANENQSAFWGMERALLANMVTAVVAGFKKELEIQGTGYSFKVQDKKLVLEVGFSHLVNMEVPEGLAVTVEKNILTVTGFDKQLVGQFAAEIRAVKKPEPYKGKGIRYIDEHVRRKEGKKAAATEA